MKLMIAATALAIVFAAPAAAILAVPAHAVVGVPLSPASESSAVRKAQDYLRLEGGFSRKGLIQQLEYDEFSEEDATSAVDSLSVDWNQQAALKAKQYLKMEGFSHEGLVGQLEYDGFTSTQAEYGTTSAGL